MLGVEQFAALGVVFMILLVTLIATCIFVIVKETVKEKVDWWHRKWRMESKLEELERRVGSLEEADGCEWKENEQWEDCTTRFSG